MSSSVNQPFLAAIQLFVDGSKQEIDEAVRRTGIKILGRLVEMSPVGQPETWQVNQTASAYNTAVREHNAALRVDPANLTKSGRLKRGLRVNDSMDIKKPEGYVGGRFKNNWYVGFDTGAGTLRKIDSWITMPQVMTLSTEGGDQQTISVQFLEDDKARTIPTFKNAVVQVYTFAHDPQLAIYKRLIDLDDSSDTTAVWFHNPRGKADRYYSAKVSFQRVPRTEINAVESNEARMNFESDMQIYPIADSSVSAKKTEAGRRSVVYTGTDARGVSRFWFNA